VRAVDVGVGHHDDAVVAKLLGVVLFLADAATQHGDQRGVDKGAVKLGAGLENNGRGRSVAGS